MVGTVKTSSSKTTNMKKEEVSLIAALQEYDNAIGYDNDLLFRIPEDLARFKAKTKNNIVIMGRKTMESISKMPLPERDNIMITRNKNFKAPEGVITVHGFEEALEKALELAYNTDKEILVMGGAEVYAIAMQYATKFYKTTVVSNKKANVFFPYYEGMFPKILEHKNHECPKTGLSYTFSTLAA
ncbi:diacylglycerol kinase [Candidatus Wolfebacteria bacterium]|nr:MAG: diacylglycerol kinase [Candidatus Wolfebacteria bacterium]